MSTDSQLKLYNSVAIATAGKIIRSYSTSFGLASRLLERDIRSRIESVYALVRVADEVVDGTAAAARLQPAEISVCLDDLERETESAMLSGYSANLVVHAFALTAREVGIGSELTRPFFRSMRADLMRTEHTEETYRDYIYGSAEVIGLMCLKCFLYRADVPDGTEEALTDGARKLGAAFQKINFLRDLAQDYEKLGRSYFPDVRIEEFSDDQKKRLLTEIAEDLQVSAAAIPSLPASSRYAVALAQSMFTELLRRLTMTPASALLQTRVRVPNPVKLRLAASVFLETRAFRQGHAHNGQLQ